MLIVDLWKKKQVIKWLTKSFLVKQECRIQKGDSD